MKITDGKLILKNEREKTDQSLTIERKKANESLIVSKELAESKTDVTLENVRTASDKTTELIRKEADEQRSEDFTASSSGDVHGKTVSEIQIQNERREADIVIEKERIKMDAVLTQERELKEALYDTLLSQERTQTDDNLKVERVKADSIVLSNSTRLSDEKAEHSKTKNLLTTRDEFLAIVSHDLRNPMGTVSSCADMLLKDENYTIDSEVRPWIELIKRNADSALRLISDVLDMERIVGGQLGLKLENHNVNKMIKESIESFILAASAKNVLLRTTPTVISNFTLFDRDRISQVLSNLIGNALKFTPDGGSIIVNAMASPSELTVSVTDSGPGIPEEKKAFIFDRFAQIKSKDRRGLGLGLYISKMLVEAHHGRIWVDSKLGQGSTFYFTLPTQKTLAET